MKTEDEKIHEAVTVAMRYSLLNQSAVMAHNALTQALSNSFADTLTQEEIKTITDARNILTRLSFTYGHYEAIQYLKTLNQIN